MTRRALVTGGAGFMGAHLAALLCRDGWETIVVDDCSAGSLGNFRYLGIKPEVRAADLSDPRALDGWGGPIPDVIFHLAGSANVARSVEQPMADFEATLRSTLHVLEFARRRGVPKLVFPSTASVYKPGVPMPVGEDAPIHASSPYGAAKVAAENYCFAYATSYGLDVTVLRFFSVYGPLMRRFAIHDWVRKLQRDPSRLEILGNGEQVREYLYVDDAARAFLLAAERGGAGEAYNVGTGVPVRIRDLARKVIEAMGLEGVRVEPTMKSWPGDVQAWYADTAKLARLGFAPKVGFDEGLRNTVLYLKEPPDPAPFP